MSSEAARSAAFASQSDKSREITAGYVKQVLQIAAQVRDLKNLLTQALSAVSLPHRWVDYHLEIQSPNGEWIGGPNLRGAMGPRGFGWLFGSGAPADGVGQDGDIYLDLATYKAYGPKAAGTWAETPIVDLRAEAAIAQAAAADAIAAAAAAALFDPATYYPRTEADALLADKAPLVSPALTGVPTAPTADPSTNTNQIATMAAVQAVVAALIDGAPGAIDTLNELASALGDDPNFATTITNALAGKASLTHTHVVDDLANASANARTLLQAANYAAMQTLLALVPGTHVQVHDAATAKTNAVQQWTKPQRSAITPLVSSATITITFGDWTGNLASLVLGHNALLANPTDLADYVGLTFSIDCKQDATGGRTLAVGSCWVPLGGQNMPDVPLGANDEFRIDAQVVNATTIQFSLVGAGVDVA